MGGGGGLMMERGRGRYLHRTTEGVRACLLAALHI